MSLPLSSEYYVINSTESNFSTTLSIPDISIGFDHVTVMSINIPKSFYSLPEDGTLEVSENGVITTITFPKGNYTYNNTFMSQFNTLINAACTYTYTISYQTIPDISKYTFSVSGNSGVQPVFTVSDAYLGGLLGLKQGVAYTFSGNSLVSDVALDFQPYDSLLLQSNIVRNSSKLLQEVYTSFTPYNSNVVFTNGNPVLNSKAIQKQATNVYSFTLVDSYTGLPVNLNNAPWSFVLCLFKADNLGEVIRDYINLELDRQHLQKLQLGV